MKILKAVICEYEPQQNQMKSYGITSRREISNSTDYHIENLKIKGFSIEQNFIGEEECSYLSEKLEAVYNHQKIEFGEQNLSKINETDLARMPFLNDDRFIDLFMHPFVLELSQKVIGNHFHLHLQNGIINRPQKEHHQSSWHRDLPYQDWVISKPLGINAFYCLSDFKADNGATFVLPYSHRLEYFPSKEFVEENEVQLVAPKGAVIFFDSMLYHRAGSNTSSEVRYGVNNMFVVPILKQQIDVASIADKISDNYEVWRVLGYDFRLENNVSAYRQRKLEKHE
jgi:ectoine hydroxylase-related dioxygenase (phytanoyl-CoA dioxygenase family)